MNKKEYMTPEVELIEMEMETTLLTISTADGEYDSGDIEEL